MPWTAADAKGHTGKADTAAKRKRWAEVANDALQRCLDKGGNQDECEASAIRQANSVIAKMGEAEEMDAEEARGQGQGVGGDRQVDGGAAMCICPECGAKVEHERGVPCTETKCPECGAAMVGEAEQEEGMGEEIQEATMKTVDGKKYPASDFLVVEDPAKPSTWHLQVKRNGTPDHGLMGGAKAALTSPGGHRGNKYEGPGKAAAIRKLKALYKSEDMEWSVAEFGLGDLGTVTLFAETDPDQQALGLAFIQLGLEILTAPPEPQGDETEEADDSDLAEFAESASGHVVGMAEARPVLPDSVVPLHLDVVLIEPGWGNPKDNHYYPADVLKRDAAVFDGVKMYESDHRPGEKSTRTWVSTVTGIKAFTDDGAPIATVSVHERSFAERLLALEADGLLGKMECSILATGNRRKGEVDGKKANVVEAITSAESVDWVTRAGAGGRALALAESAGGDTLDEETREQEPQESELEETTISEQEEPETPAPETLAKEKVAEILAGTNLPDVSKAKLAESEYPDEGAVKAAIAAEVEYVKAVTGSGRVTGMGKGSGPQPMTLEEFEKRAQERHAQIKRRLGIG